MSLFGSEHDFGAMHTFVNDILKDVESAVVEDVFKPSTQETEAGQSLQGLPVLLPLPPECWSTSCMLELQVWATMLGQGMIFKGSVRRVHELIGTLILGYQAE